MKEIKDAYDRPWPLDDVVEGVGPGWEDIVRRLVTDLFALGWDGDLHQIKEKFGGLRFYIGVGNEALWKRIDQAEDESMRTCEQCGQPGETSSWGGYWINALCPAHGKERQDQITADRKAAVGRNHALAEERLQKG